MAELETKTANRRLVGPAVAAIAVVCVCGCPIARPPVPPAYYEFREVLQEAVADTVTAELRGDVEAQDRLEARLTDLAAILRTDSLVLSLDSDPVLWPLASAISFVLNRTLRSDRVEGSARSAFRNPAGQRQAVDAIVIGLGRALWRLREEGQPSRSDVRCSLRLASQSALPLRSLHCL